MLVRSAVTAMNLRDPQRLGSAAVAVFNIVGVVIVFVAVLSIAEACAAWRRPAIRTSRSCCAPAATRN